MIKIDGKEGELRGNGIDIMADFMTGITIMLEGITEDKELQLMMLSDMFKGIAEHIDDDDVECYS